jgi:hypothetical protein
MVVAPQRKQHINDQNVLVSRVLKMMGSAAIVKMEMCAA